MSDLSKFPQSTKLSEAQKAVLVSVPYRVGVWVSNIDDNTKTSLDDRRERQALELSIARMEKLYRKMPFTAAIMGEIQQSKSLWEGWTAQSAEDLVLQNLSDALALCDEYFGRNEVGQYKHAVWQVGLSVAQAYGEQIDPDNEMHVNRLFAWMGSFISAPKMSKAPENMSAKEKTALKKLRALLKE